MTTYAPLPHLRRPTGPLTATVRDRDGEILGIAESAAYDDDRDFLSYVWGAIAAGYRVELVAATGDVDIGGYCGV